MTKKTKYYYNSLEQAKKHPCAGHKSCTSTFAGTANGDIIFLQEIKMFTLQSYPNEVESFFLMGVRPNKNSTFQWKNVLPRLFFDVSLNQLRFYCFQQNVL